MKTLALQDGIFDEIVRLAHLYGELEFAVTIFGFIRGERFEVTHIAQPGPGSKSMAAARATTSSSPTSSIACGRKNRAFSGWVICMRIRRATPGSPERMTRCIPKSTSPASSCLCAEPANQALPSCPSTFQR